MKSLTRAIVFPRLLEVELRDLELPPRKEWDVLVELESSAISIGTERWALTGKRPEGDVTFPCVPGYLSIGRVLEAGESAWALVSAGERINFLAARIPEGYGGNWMCGHLSPALVDIDPSAQGSYAGMPYVEKVPDGLASEEASLAGLAAVACRGIDMAGIGADQVVKDPRVVVLGQGVIGHAAAQLCRLRGAKVLTADVAPSRVALSRELAAEIAIDSREENLKERVMDFTGGQGADVVIDTTGSMAMLGQAADLLKIFGTVVLQGWYPPPNTLDFHKLQLKFARVLFPCGHSGDAVARCMRLMRTGSLRLKPLITHRFRPEQAREAYDLILDRPQDCMAVVFDWRGNAQ